MRRTLPTSFAFLALLAVAPLARAGDDATPADRTAKLLASLPAPSEKGAFKFEGSFFVHGVNFGPVVWDVSASTQDDKPVWKGEEKVELDVGGKTQVHKSVNVLGQDLRALRIEKTDEDEKGTKTTVATRTEQGFDVTFSGGGEAEKKVSVEADPQAMSSIPAMLLFVRALPAEPASYEVQGVDFDKAKRETARFDVTGPGKFVERDTSVDAWVVHGKKEGESLDLFLDPADRSLIAFRAPEKGILVVRNGVIPAPKPATSAIEAGRHFAIGLLTSDDALVQSSIHWPTLYADAKTTKGYAGDEKAFKNEVMGGVRSGYKTLTLEQATTAVDGAVKGAKESEKDGATEVVFGPPMEKFGYTAKSIDGAWYIVKFKE